MCVNCPNGETVGKLFGDFEKRLMLLDKTNIGFPLKNKPQAGTTL